MKKIFNKAVVIIIAITLVFASVAFGGCNSGATNNDALLYELAALRQQLEQLQQGVAASNAELLEQVEELQRQMEELQAEIERLEREIYIARHEGARFTRCGRFSLRMSASSNSFDIEENITVTVALKNWSGQRLRITYHRRLFSLNIREHTDNSFIWWPPFPVTKYFDKGATIKQVFVVNRDCFEYLPRAISAVAIISIYREGEITLGNFIDLF